MVSLSMYRRGFHHISSSKLFRALFKSLPRRLVKRSFNFGPECCNQSVPDIAKGIAKAENILVMAGAGMSTPSGIPDFRTPGRAIWPRQCSQLMSVLSIVSTCW